MENLLNSKTEIEYFINVLRDNKNEVVTEVIREESFSESQYDAASFIFDEETDPRVNAAERLGNIRDRAAVEALTEVLKDGVPALRGTAATALGKIGDKRGVEPLLVLLKDQESWIRIAAIGALSKIGGSQVVEPIIKMLDDENSEVREEAAFALGWLEDERAEQPLIKIAIDVNEKPKLRASAIYSLGQVGGKHTLECLLGLLEDLDSFIRYYAVDGLRLLNDEKAMDPLIVRLADANSEVRSRVIIALNCIDKRFSTRKVISHLNWVMESDPDNVIKQEAKFAIEDIRRREL